MKEEFVLEGARNMERAEAYAGRVNELMVDGKNMPVHSVAEASLAAACSTMHAALAQAYFAAFQAAKEGGFPGVNVIGFADADTRQKVGGRKCKLKQ